jgi:hypothetical protein
MKTCKPSISKSLKTLKLRKKVPAQLFDPSSNNDFILETQGNVREFLSPGGKFAEDSNPMQNQILRHNMIGPISNFHIKVLEPFSTITKKLSPLAKIQPRQSVLVPKVDYQSRFNEVMRKINEALEKAKQEEKLQKIEDFEESQKKKSKSVNKRKFSLVKLDLEPQLTEITEKKNKSTKSVNLQTDSLSWYMSLRQTEESEYGESYLRIGPEINGLYTKIKKPNPSFRTPQEVLTEKFDDLVVIGENKLNLEIQAVSKVGAEYLKPELLSLTSGVPDEVIAWNYPELEDRVIR